ncbi:MAG TPA: M48 family metallopeptidase [Thermoanaerobaculia bacterium]|nr:M48 family metallopeptidase [Thermoanaerobaculia bacterium]
MFELIRANRRRSAILVAVMALLLFGIGWSVGEISAEGAGPFGLVVALLVWIVLTLISYFFGDRIVLGISRAKKIDQQDHPVLHNIVEEMCIASGTSKLPDLYIIDDEAPNAFATGRDPEHASVAVTSGLLNLLTRDELQGVIAHEIAHVRNRDVLYMMMVAVMMGTIIILGDGARRLMFYGRRSRTSSRGKGGGAQAIVLIVAVVLIILAPIIARFVYLAISRRREYLADASGAQYSRYPEGLASALEKIGGSTRKLRTATQATAPMYFVNPLKVTARGLANLSATHPPLADRIRILRSMGGMADLRAYDEAFRKVSGRAVGVVPFRAAEQGGRTEAKKPSPVPVPSAGSPMPMPMPLPMPMPGSGGGPSAGMGLPGMAALAPAAAAEAASHVQRVRETTDLLWKKQGYTIIDCPCETRLKIPPAHRRRKIDCPHCGRTHVAA